MQEAFKPANAQRELRTQVSASFRMPNFVDARNDQHRLTSPHMCTLHLVPSTGKAGLCSKMLTRLMLCFLHNLHGVFQWYLLCKW